MKTEIKTGSFVHVVATINKTAGDGKIMYVNPSVSTIASDAATDKDVELVAYDGTGKEVYREPVVIRRSSAEPDRPNEVGLIQADLPRVSGMKSVSLQLKGKEISRYEAGAAPSGPTAGATFGLELAGAAAASRRPLRIDQLGGLQPVAGVTYSVQVKPDNKSTWDTIAVSRPTPEVDVDRNQFAGAKRAAVRVLRTTGFDEEIIAEDTVDLK
ncbi:MULTISPECIES: hypothetical protein [Bradyrhizobium]|jgi:hypothetical protein|uniref:Uncharacterized protein n=1 Tax=Bradyrhizobium japonicum TaxID=375 RepID=A0A1Y2JF38_BRAJP|nr:MULTISPECIES: hypothetical protein [Bradyrhizobium]OSJ24930.1 hypothetical protein BSZ19_40300 [Bradyrhizobium japonicum]TFW59742.1 hypothetical protein CT676_18025 [Bradyrhizobium sp. MOS001]